MAGELVAYKRPELAVEAFNALGRRLIVIGGGEMLAEVRKLAGPTVTIMDNSLSASCATIMHGAARWYFPVRRILG